MINKLRNLALILFGSFVLAGLASVPALAFNPFQDVCSQGGARDSATCQSNSTINPISGNDGVIIKATRVVALLAGIAAVIMIIISGFQFITSGGDAQKVATAKQTILYAVIGILIAVLAQAIISFVLSRL